MSLTKKQFAVLTFCYGKVPFPTFREMEEHFSYKSPNSVTQNMKALVKKGYLKKDIGGYVFTKKGNDLFRKNEELSAFKMGYYTAKLETQLNKKKASEIIGISHSNFTAWGFPKSFSAYYLKAFLERNRKHEYKKRLLDYLGV